MRLTTRWRRPGMLRNVLSKLYDGVAGRTVSGAIPGASARNR